MGAPKLQSSELRADRRDFGKADTLRFNVLTYVVEGKYERAIECLEDFIKSDFEYPRVRERSERFIDHAKDLVHAIRAKRNFPGVASLTMAKQQELNDMYRRHFEELQMVLKKVEKIQMEQKIEDIRSTVWVLKTLCLTLLVVSVVAFSLDVSSGLFKTSALVVDEYFTAITRWLFGG